MPPTKAGDPVQPASVPVLRPSVLTPAASNAAVHEFLVQFLLSQACSRSQNEAHEIANRLNADGTALYELTEKRLVDELGMEGETIYHALTTSKYGLYKMAIIGPSLKWLDQCFSIRVFSTGAGSSGLREISETRESPSPLPSSPPYLSSSTYSVNGPGSLIANGFQKDSKSENEQLQQQQDHGDFGRPQVSLEPTVHRIQFRRRFSHDID